MLKPIGGADNQPVEPSTPQNPVTPQAPQQAPIAPSSAPSAPIAPPVGYRAPVYEPEPTSKAPLIVGISAAVLLLGGGTLWLFKPEGKPTIPVAWASFSAPDGSFACESPEGWTVRGTGHAAEGGSKMSEDNGVHMDSGAAHVEVSFSSVSGLVTKQLLFGKEMTPEAMTGSRANGVFSSQKSGMKKRFNELTETPIPAPESKMASIDRGSLAALGGASGSSGNSEELKELKDLKELFKPDIRIVEFTGKKSGLGMGRPVQGIRATLGGREQIASVVCYCPPGDYAALKPSFLRVIGSITETRKPGDGSMTLQAPGFGGVTVPGSPPKDR
ncbi:MAG: hypothetical protein QM758_19075 [Armatimonas sp.]